MRSHLLALVILMVACKNSVGPERCFRNDDCAGDQACIRLPSGAQTCADRCDTAKDLVCTDTGRTCATVEGTVDPDAGTQVDVCLPGGKVAFGSNCDVTRDCVEGAVCVSRVGVTHARCERLCDAQQGLGCSGSEVCTALDAANMLRGTCVVP